MKSIVRPSLQRSARFRFLTALALVMSLSPAVFASTAAPPAFSGEKTLWHGFSRYDFVMDDESLAITPFKSPANEGDGVGAPEAGKHRCVIVVPDQSAPGNPWSWRGCYWNHQPQAEMELLKHGFCIAYISAGATLRPGKQWDAWYAFLTGHGLSAKPAFVGMSRGGEFAYTWATSHPDEVSCIYADNPYVPPEILMKLGLLANNDVPLLHVCGSLDPLLGNSSTAVENIYQQFGGRISVMIKDGFAHHPHSLPDPKPIVDFMVRSVGETAPLPPGFVGDKFVKTHFYGVENLYRYFPEERADITCRGPMFTPCYDRYQFGAHQFPGAG
ncbi:MAG TPA: alpha/beta hydrolase, partial [Chthoniobacteraceae bacterium]|nr:alpha/beta hydrolase [Chthoniobacteraceae bacterium]